ncbi:MAG: hypothetical protein LBU22_08645 [Dysgonamonadaceae bacterium]|jgi:hypothetical protein|nr:hypothetical protein [Dysgonamonadaceae bacterium]
MRKAWRKVESNKAGLPVEAIAAITQLTPDEIVSILKGDTIASIDSISTA